MMDDEMVEQARRRQLNGHDDEIDRWRMRVAERREEKTMARTTLDTNSAEAWGAWFTERFDEAVRERLIEDVGEVLGTTAAELRADYTAKMHQLELTVARLEGELKGRMAKGDDAIVAAKLVSDAIEKPLCNYIDERVKAMQSEAKSEVIDLPSWRNNAA